MTKSSKASWIAVALFLAGLWALNCVEQDPNVVYVCFGDSATEGADSPKYPWYLKQWLGLKDEQLKNEGKSGETAHDGLDRLSDIIEGNAYPNAHTFLYWEGGNDMIDWVLAVEPTLLLSPKSPNYPFKEELEAKLDQVQDDIHSAVKMIKESRRRVIIGTYYHLLPYKSPCDPTPLDFLTAVQAANANEYIDLLNERIYEVAEWEDIEVADIAASGALYGQYDNYVNCNHASGKGNEVIAGFFYNAIMLRPIIPRYKEWP